MHLEPIIVRRRDRLNSGKSIWTLIKILFGRIQSDKGTMMGTQKVSSSPFKVEVGRGWGRLICLNRSIAVFGLN
jgi:hypothetical protein